MSNRFVFNNRLYPYIPLADAQQWCNRAYIGQFLSLKLKGLDKNFMWQHKKCTRGKKYESNFFFFAKTKFWEKLQHISDFDELGIRTEKNQIYEIKFFLKSNIFLSLS